MAKKDQKRTVASFLSDRLKQQVNENYDYLEENTRRVHSSASDLEDVISDIPSKQPERSRPVQGASSALSASSPLVSPSSAVTDLSKITVSEADTVIRETSVNDLYPQRLPLESFNSVTSGFFDQVEKESLQTSVSDESLATEDASIKERVGDLAKRITPSEEKIEKTSPEALGSTDVERVFGEVNKVSGNYASPVAGYEADYSQGIPVPEKVINLLTTGKIPLRCIQIYLAMFKDAGLKIGGIATLSYNEIAALTTIQTPHIPGILKSLVEMELIERFRSEKTATTKNSYKIL